MTAAENIFPSFYRSPFSSSCSCIIDHDWLILKRKDNIFCDALALVMPGFLFEYVI